LLFDHQGFSECGDSPKKLRSGWTPLDAGIATDNEVALASFALTNYFKDQDEKIP
jgi:hypothetical protein